MKTLQLFNAVLQKETDEDPFVSQQRYVVEPGALWVKDKISRFYRTSSPACIKIVYSEISLLRFNQIERSPT